MALPWLAVTPSRSARLTVCLSGAPTVQRRGYQVSWEETCWRDRWGTCTSRLFFLIFIFINSVTLTHRHISTPVDKAFGNHATYEACNNTLCNLKGFLLIYLQIFSVKVILFLISFIIDGFLWTVSLWFMKLQYRPVEQHCFYFLFFNLVLQHPPLHATVCLSCCSFNSGNVLFFEELLDLTLC